MDLESLGKECYNKLSLTEKIDVVGRCICNFHRRWMCDYILSPRKIYWTSSNLKIVTTAKKQLFEFVTKDLPRELPTKKG